VKAESVDGTVADVDLRPMLPLNVKSKLPTKKKKV
jgi:hypothetical protein